MSITGRVCAYCRKVFAVAKTSKVKTCSDRCRAHMNGQSWCEAANVARVDDGAYWKLYIPDHPNANAQGYVREHVWVASRKLGRAIAEGEDVHHKDENKRNNHPDNLEVVTHSEHQREHGGWTLLEDGSWLKPCARCEKKFPADTVHFSPRNEAGTLLSSYCKPCQNAKKREDRAAQSSAEDDDGAA